MPSRPRSTDARRPTPSQRKSSIRRLFSHSCCLPLHCAACQRNENALARFVVTQTGGGDAEDCSFSPMKLTTKVHILGKYFNGDAGERRRCKMLVNFLNVNRRQPLGAQCTRPVCSEDSRDLESIMRLGREGCRETQQLIEFMKASLKQ